MLRQDLYFTPEYGKLYEKLEQASFRSFSYREENGEIYYQYLKRKVPCLIDGNQYYDAMTPYGYGGPLVIRCESGKEGALVRGFQQALDKHLKEEHVICEFVRFHPMAKNAEFFQPMYTLWNRRTAVYTDLSAEDPVAAEFNKHTKKLVRNAIRKGVTTVITRDPSEEVKELFQECYYENMRAVGASEYYFFDPEYFDELWEKFHKRLIVVLAYYEGELVGADLGFDDYDVYTCHLMGVTSKGRLLDVARVIIAEQVRWAKEHGFRFLFHGCGKTADENDSLLTFKKYFTKGCFYDYWQGTRICDPLIYSKVCQNVNKTDDGTYFPAYRKS